MATNPSPFSSAPGLGIYSLVAKPSGDATGAQDVANLNAAFASPNVSVLLSPGTYFQNGPVNISQANCTLLGGGLGNTARTGASVLQPVAAFAGVAPVNITGFSCTAANFSVLGPTTTATSNPVCNGLELTGSKFSNIHDLFFQYINGWCVESLATAGTPNIGTSLYNLTGYNSAGGVHVKGVSGSSFQGQHSLIDMQFSQIGVASGPNANLDALMFEDCADILTSNTNCAVSSASTGSTMHIKGLCATHTHCNVDVGVFPIAGTANSVILIEDSVNGSPSQIYFDNGVSQAGNVALTISGGANQITFTNFLFKNQQTHGVVLSGTGFQIDFRGCTWGLNGQVGTGTNYDLNVSGTPTGTVRHCRFTTPVVAASSGPGIQQVVNLSVSGQNIPFTDNLFSGTGSIISTIFANLPSIIRNCSNYNPKGSQTVTVPATGVATTALHNDAMFYVTAGATSVTVTRNTGGAGGSGGPGVVVAAAATQSFWIPAQTTVTFTYTNAPTLQVDGA